MHCPQPGPRATALAMHLCAAKQAAATAINADRAAGVPYFDIAEAVTDVAITPFLAAMRAAGWIPELHESGCLVETQPCKHCRQAASRYAFVRDTTEIRCCAYCDT
jgi:hypothetical protein